MFEKAMERAARKARGRARARRDALARRLEAELPRGIRVEAAGDAVRLSGRALARRFALDARLRWLVAGLVR